MGISTFNIKPSGNYVSICKNNIINGGGGLFMNSISGTPRAMAAILPVWVIIRIGKWNAETLLFHSTLIFNQTNGNYKHDKQIRDLLYMN